MRFEWDRKKAEKNLKIHKVSFDEAMTVFYDPLSATFDDPDHSFNEERSITIGHSSRGRLICGVTYRAAEDTTYYQCKACNYA